MEIKEIQVTYGRTWQLRQFEPLNISISLSASITSDEDVTIALEKLQDIAKESVKKIGHSVVREVWADSATERDAKWTSNNSLR